MVFGKAANLGTDPEGSVPKGTEQARFEISVAPMMERTDRHYRYLVRLISPTARLYTEMITSAALLRGDAKSLLAFHESEHPVAAQLGGNEPPALAEAARMVAAAGYDEINLNVGCPSPRVQAGAFGARLMLEPELVAECVAAMRGSGLPVTVKTRIGVDHQDDYEVLRGLTQRVVAAGAERVIVHARKAWLKGLSPKQNREIPPLDYPRVYRLKADFPTLPIVINGGFTTAAQVLEQTGRVDGVMLGRAAYHNPLLLAQLDARLADPPATRQETSSVEANALVDLGAIVSNYATYMRQQLALGTPLKAMSRHLIGLIANQPGAKRWRRQVATLENAGSAIDDLLSGLPSMRYGTLYNAQNGTSPSIIQSAR